MGRRSALAVGALLGSLAGILFFERLLEGTRRVDLYYEDGSMVSLAGRSDDAGRVLDAAQDALRAAL